MLWFSGLTSWMSLPLVPVNGTLNLQISPRHYPAVVEAGARVAWASKWGP